MSVVDQPVPSGSRPGATEADSPSGQAALPRTALPSRPATRQQPRRRQLGGLRRNDVLAMVGALASALATTGLLWTIAPFTGIFGFIVVSWCLFVLIYALLVAFDNNRPTVRDRISAAVVHSLAVLVLLVLGLIIVYTVVKGWKALVHANFYTQDMQKTTPLSPLTSGGILYAIVGTLIELAIAMGIAVPLGLLAAVFLNEVPGRLNRLVRTVVDAMTALPDILAGLFIYATLIIIFGLGFCGLAAACALAVTVICIICRTAYVVLRLVPGGLTEASYALGSGQWRTVWHVTLPTARSGLATAVILGAARAIGETSPLLLTAGATFYMNVNPFSSPMSSLPLAAYTLVENPEPYYQARGFGCAAVLLVVVLVLFGIARMIGGRGAGQLTSRQLARRMAASHRDQVRYGRTAAAQPATAGGAGLGADDGGPSA